MISEHNSKNLKIPVGKCFFGFNGTPSWAPMEVKYLGHLSVNVITSHLNINKMNI